MDDLDDLDVGAELVSARVGEVWSYGELNERAGRLAARLRALGAGPGEVVAICLERSPELVAAVLGVGKSGAAYLPLDPAHPVERLAWQLEDAGVRLLVTDERGAGLANGLCRAVVVEEEALTPSVPLSRPAPHPSTLPPGEGEVAQLDAGEAWEGGGAPLPGAGGWVGGGSGEGTGVRAPDALAYVIYTSGSTGRPKGTLLGQRGLANLVVWHRRSYGLTPASRTTLVAGVGFDASVWELWPALASGASLWIPPAATLAAPPVLAHWLAEQSITHCFLPTPLAEAVLDEGLPESHRLQYLLTGGDRLHRSAPAGSRFRLVNHYGPTEATVVSTAWEVPPGSPNTPPIGRPIANLRTLLLDRTFTPVPPGVAGELYVGGIGLAWGYLGRAELTAARFLPDAFAAPSHGPGARPIDRNGGLGARLYATGDLARFRPDGVLEFLGRADQQVKVRGHRIELGEIEAVLAAHPAVREAAVLVAGTGRDARLDAYLVPRSTDEASPDLLRTWLAERLPAALIPTGWTVLDALPLNASGKVDRRALASLSAAGQSEQRRSGSAGDRPAPATPTEELLAAIWADLLKVERVGRDDHFFHLGGHSLLAARLATRIRDAFGVDLGVARTFEVPTLAAQAAEIEKALGTGRDAGPSLVPIGREVTKSGAELPASFAQERLWFLDQLAPGSPAYNIAGGVRLTGDLNVAVLAAGLARIVDRHEVLRTTFAAREGRPVQEIGPARASLPLLDLAVLPASAREAEAARLAREEAARPFDLARGPLLRCTLLRLRAQAAGIEHRLLISLHHVVGDGWSMGVLVRELGEQYRSGLAGEAARLPVLPVQYADFAAWQRTWLAGEELERQTAFWRDRLAGAPAALDLPVDRPRPPVQSHAGSHVALTLPASLRTGLEALARRRGATPFMVLLAAFDALLLRTTGQDDLVVGTPVAGRTRREIEDLIGFFVNTLPLRTDLAGDPDFGTALGRVRQSVLSAFTHQDLPFEKLVEALAPERDRSRSPLFQVMLAFQASALAGLDLPGLAAEPFASSLKIAKFDLTLDLGESAAGGYAGRLEYCRDLFDRTTIERLAGRLRVLLEAIATDPDRRLSDLPDLTAAERQQLLDWNATATHYPEAGFLLHELIARQAALTPQAPAVVFDGADLHSRIDRAGSAGFQPATSQALKKSRQDAGAPSSAHGLQAPARAELSYRDLWESSGRLAAHLRGLGAGPEVRVGICAERSLELVIGLLAILRAGAAYVPLDPSYPADRLAYMLADSGVPLLLAQSRLAELLPAHGATVVWLDGFGGDRQDPSEAALHPDAFDVSPDGLAYVIYTSGSTGQPKGAMNTHRAIVNRLLWMQAAYGLTPADRVLQKTPFSFDVSVWEFFWPLLTGACLVVARPGGHREPAYLVRTHRSARHHHPALRAVHAPAFPGDARCRALCLAAPGDRERRGPALRPPAALLRQARRHRRRTPQPLRPDRGRGRRHLLALRPGGPPGRGADRRAGRQHRDPPARPPLVPVPLGVAGELLHRRRATGPRLPGQAGRSPPRGSCRIRSAWPILSR